MSSSPIAVPLLAWYESHRRDLPWRAQHNPYHIWISEIILQQTRVAQGLDYYHRFIDHFPTIEALATASLDQVLVCWQGLGYYSRARNLHAAARDIMERFGGTFPTHYKEVLSLKGVGEYTAAAICSFAWRQPYAVVDGNVYRVLSRLFAIDTPIDTTTGRKLFASLAQELLDTARPDDYNQAIMDFGATCCTPRQPLCTTCPLQAKCLAFAHNSVATYPIKQGRVTVKSRYFNYLFIVCGEHTWIRQREGGDIWQGLYEFPLIESDRELTLAELQSTTTYGELLPVQVEAQVAPHPYTKRHLLTHRTIYANFYTVQITHPSPALQQYQQLSIGQLSHYAISRLTQQFVATLAPSLLG